MSSLNCFKRALYLAMVLALALLVSIGTMAQVPWAWGEDMNGQLGDGRFGWETSPVQASGLTYPTYVACGYYHTLVVENSGGTVWAYGQNNYGQLGNGTNNPSAVPVQVTGLTGASQIAAGAQHSMALVGGVVWAWGRNDFGQLGDGTQTTSNVPVQVHNLTNVTAIACGSTFSFAISGGNLYAWGANSSGDLGDGTKTQRLEPVQITGLTRPVISIAGGGAHGLAVEDNGTVWAWGSNYVGQLGNGSYVDSLVPLQVPSLVATKVSAGNEFSLALKSDATIMAWGANNAGQLGDGTWNNSNHPVQVLNMVGIIAIAAGGFHTIALKTDLTVWACGYNSYGELGTGSQNYSNVGVQVPGLTGIVYIAGGYYHSVAKKNDWTAWGWGHCYYGQLGNGRFGYQMSPIRTESLGAGVTMEAGNRHSIAALAGGTAMTCGDGSQGQLGNGVWGYSNLFTQVSNLTDTTMVAGGGYFNLALQGDGTVWAWGSGGYGQLGNGLSYSSSTPVQVSYITSSSPAIAVAAGDSHSLALMGDHTVKAWGYNSNGQLGTDSTTNSNVPVTVPGILDVTAVSAGYRHSVALKSGIAYAWGANAVGQLGHMDTTEYHHPVQVYGVMNLTAIACGGNHTLALRDDGTVWAWGYNASGQLGNGNYTTATSAVQVTGGLTGVTAIAAGFDHSLALKSDGTVWAWGANDSGQLGNGTLSKSNVPIQITSLANIDSIAAGGYHSFAFPACNTISISPTSLPSGTTGVSYSQPITSSGCTSYCRYKISSGELPGGLILFTHGSPAITGTPTSAGVFDFSLTATDVNGCSTTIPYELVIARSSALYRVPYSIAPVKITTTDHGSSGTVTWDATNCASANYHIVYGYGSGLSSFSVSGGVCSLGTSGSATWSTIPSPASDSSKFLWFVVVGDNGAFPKTEGSWGLTSAGTERGGTANSGVCLVSAKSTTGSCGTQ
jgi:alpha-tubulin suppressor-like RCC1 family protein